MRAMMEYKRFLQKNLNNLSDYEKKISRLILENFSEVANTVSAKGQRGKYISDLVNKNRDVQPDLGEIDSTSQDQSATFSRLTKISIGNFRGFSDEHSLEFKTPYTFVYGPNGTGKSSLCEALEYCLIGSISEADAKRIPTQEYIKNAYSNKSSDPILIGIDQSGKEAKVTPNQQAYEFCFVEKNRIDGFARVSANTPQAQQSRLAALFGLEEFNSFVSQFNESITMLICSQN